MKKCRNCKNSFGLNFSLGFENEPVGECIGCMADLCQMCVHRPRIETHAVIDPEGYISDGILFCGKCARRVGIPVEAAVA